MDIKSMFMSKLDGFISDYQAKKESLGPIMPGDINKRSKRKDLIGAIKALNTLKQQVESIKSYTSASDFTGEVELQIKVTCQSMRYVLFPNGVTYQDAKSGILEALKKIRDCLSLLEAEVEGQ